MLFGLAKTWFVSTLDWKELLRGTTARLRSYSSLIGLLVTLSGGLRSVESCFMVRPLEQVSWTADPHHNQPLEDVWANWCNRAENWLVQSGHLDQRRSERNLGTAPALRAGVSKVAAGQPVTECILRRQLRRLDELMSTVRKEGSRPHPPWSGPYCGALSRSKSRGLLSRATGVVLEASCKGDCLLSLSRHSSGKCGLEASRAQCETRLCLGQTRYGFHLRC